MAIIKNVNYKRKAITGVKSGDTIEDCNCTQQEMNTAVCKGLSKLTVINSNCHNCVFPLGTKFIKCKPFQKEIIPTPEPTPAEICKRELEDVKRQYPFVSKEEAKIVFGLKDNVLETP